MRVKPLVLLNRSWILNLKEIFYGNSSPVTSTTTNLYIDWFVLMKNCSKNLLDSDVLLNFDEIFLVCNLSLPSFKMLSSWLEYLVIRTLPLTSTAPEGTVSALDFRPVWDPFIWHSRCTSVILVLLRRLNQPNQ